jgi:hypothetical protein
LFSTSSIYIAKKRPRAAGLPDEGRQGPARRGTRLPVSLLSLLLSFAHSCSLFSISSIYIAKNACLPQVYLPKAGRRQCICVAVPGLLLD